MPVSLSFTISVHEKNMIMQRELPQPRGGHFSKNKGVPNTSGTIDQGIPQFKITISTHQLAIANLQHNLSASNKAHCLADRVCAYKGKFTGFPSLCISKQQPRVGPPASEPHHLCDAQRASQSYRQHGRLPRALSSPPASPAPPISATVMPA